MTHIKHDIEIDASVETVYNQWTQFEEFPRFMQSVKSVSQIDDCNLRWKAVVAGRAIEWSTTITEQEPNRRIRWQSTRGAPNAGSVTFEALDGGARTLLTLRLDYQPSGLFEQAGDAIGLVRSSGSGDLARFKEFIESRGVESGAWRGRVQRGHVVTPPASETR